jgi:AcrR family transcriptional regulator
LYAVQVFVTVLNESPRVDWRTARRDAARATILAAAWDLVRTEGLAALSLRELARRAGITTPTVYSYFDSKNAIYDAMFAQAWTDVLETKPKHGQLPDDPRAAMKQVAHFFFDWAVADPARYLLTSQRTIPGFEPSAEGYAPAVAVMEETFELFDKLGIPRNDVDLYTAFVGGLVAQQVANDPGGNRWKKQVDRAMDAFCDAVGVPPAQTARVKSRGKR